jgi:hypothetical protein
MKRLKKRNLLILFDFFSYCGINRRKKGTAPNSNKGGYWGLAF